MVKILRWEKELRALFPNAVPWRAVADRERSHNSHPQWLEYAVAFLAPSAAFKRYCDDSKLARKPTGPLHACQQIESGPCWFYVRPKAHMMAHFVSLGLLAEPRE